MTLPENDGASFPAVTGMPLQFTDADRAAIPALRKNPWPTIGDMEQRIAALEDFAKKINDASDRVLYTHRKKDSPGI